jgi:hypothetical protein
LTRFVGQRKKRKKKRLLQQSAKVFPVTHFYLFLKLPLASAAKQQQSTPALPAEGHRHAVRKVGFVARSGGDVKPLLLLPLLPLVPLLLPHHLFSAHGGCRVGRAAMAVNVTNVHVAKAPMLGNVQDAAAQSGGTGCGTGSGSAHPPIYSLVVVRWRRLVLGVRACVHGYYARATKRGAAALTFFSLAGRIYLPTCLPTSCDYLRERRSSLTAARKGVVLGRSVCVPKPNVWIELPVPRISKLGHIPLVFRAQRSIHSILGGQR